MKSSLIKLTALLVIFSFSFTQINAQVRDIKLVQKTGMFATESLNVAPGQYQFAIANDGVDHEVGFVLVPKGQYDPANHIKAAYVKAPAATGKTSMTNVVDLKAGEYEYFCPLNPTAKYPLTVTSGVTQVKFTQTPGKFKNENISLAAGAYQFEVANESVEGEVGFVLVPQGQYEPANHIKEAYVISTVPTGKSSFTNVVNLEPGTYEYFCPMNNTEKYTIEVK